MIVKKDSLAFLKEQKDFAFDINYSDPPYALGSEIIIRADGKYDYKKATDFMNKWEMPTGEYWESWFEESFRTLKHGGYCIMYGMDRQLPMFQYYAIKSGFQVRQSMYWYFISSFPKATDLSKMIDKNANVEREVVGKKSYSMPKADNTMKENSYGISGGKLANGNSAERIIQNITKATTDFAKKYEGYKYSIAPLKQTCETIMVFQKPYKTGSCMHDVLAYENGDDTCGCFALNIDAGRVSTNGEKINIGFKGKILDDNNGCNNNNVERTPYDDTKGRYPSQTFCDSGTAERLDEQSGLSKANDSVRNNKKRKDLNIYGNGKGIPQVSLESNYSDIGGCSKILHKCDYENGEMDLYVYEPKVSKSERNAGCEEFEEKEMGKNQSSLDGGKILTGSGNERNNIQKNTHPTLKPISLSYRILKLFKSPNEQKIIYPFAGVQSEVIGGYKAGFIDYVGCELSEEYVNIGNARFEYWKNKPFDKKGKLEKTKDVKKINEQIKLF
jgi:DNA modification methylase